MIGPAKNRLHDYEAGWLTLLIEMGVATRAEAQAAMNRVAQAAIDEMEAKRQSRSQNRRKKRPE
jgi:ABC-type transporter MlaC component